MCMIMHEQAVAGAKLDYALQICRDLAAYFHSGEGPLRDSLQGWDYAKLERTRKRAIKLVGETKTRKRR